MSGYKCPLCRHIFVDGFFLRETRDIRFNHLTMKHPRFGIVNGESVHCPVMGCCFICPSLEAFEFHCERRHYDSGTYRCKYCPAEAIPFMSQIGLVRHECCGHGINRFEKQESGRADSKRNRSASADMRWIIGEANIYPQDEGTTRIKKMKYNYGGNACASKKGKRKR